MNGFINHLLITLRLNLRNIQALVFGYVVPTIFLFIFATVYGKSVNPALQMARVLTITTLGGACFGMPVALVSERERGVWRRLKLVPIHIGWFILSTMLSRYVIVLTSGILQVALGVLILKWNFPAHPFELLVAYSFTTFAFLGLGLVIAMIANSPLSVQYMGQLIFIPMIIVGGVGINLKVLPQWVAHVSVFTPGYYAVEALRVCFSENDSLQSAGFPLLALLVAGFAGCLACATLFRWAPEQKPPRSAKWWAMLALISWLAVGGFSEYQRLNSRRAPTWVPVQPATPEAS